MRTDSSRARIGAIHFPTKEAKAAYMTEQAIADAGLPEVQRWAAVFRALPLTERVPAILRFAQMLEYVRDPGEEWLEDAEVTLLRGYGDCDAKERVFVALCTACGIPAVGVPVFRGESFPHVMAAAYAPLPAGSNGVVWRWMKVDPTIQNSGLGWIPPYRLAKTNHW
jgi:transglutaminase-like putative cysteine protease